MAPHPKNIPGFHDICVLYNFYLTFLQFIGMLGPCLQKDTALKTN